MAIRGMRRSSYIARLQGRDHRDLGYARDASLTAPCLISMPRT